MTQEPEVDVDAVERSAPPTEPSVNPPAPVRDPPEGLTASGKVRRTRVSAVWIGFITAAILLILLLVFIGQNSGNVTVHFLGFHGRVSLAVALLLSAVAGVLLVAIPGSARIVQLRRALKKNARSL
jgi:uncharacterized integral membrane protein